ncbi:hypothetical protein PITC_045560 [Penicillium italicum]|uniref:Ankyrin repeat-containing domain-containing protein n=1 Tax=Penicillium italicum TaxID=40296 RepID=A0A0A2KS36_PENIT|nr:hypothetical protein PITC_045560 [Penicillium italicum]
MCDMAYPTFHQAHPELAGWVPVSEPVFNDTDDSPLYEHPYQELLRSIVASNDVAALRLYHASPHTRVFWGDYEVPYWHPFRVAEEHDSCEALRVLLEIYLSDPAYQTPEYRPMVEYLARWNFSPIHMACAAADRDLTLWLLSKKRQGEDERPLATLQDPGLDYDGRTPLITAVSGLTRYGDDIERREAFICFLLDDLGCKVRDSDVSCSFIQGRRQQILERVPRADHYDANAQEEKDAEEKEFTYTVLGAAIPHASYRMTARLIAAGANVHALQSWTDTFKWCTYDERIIIDSKGVTASHIACLYGNLEGLSALVDHRGGVSVAEMMARADDQGRLPLHWALLGASEEGPGSIAARNGDDLDQILAEDGMTPRSRRMIATVKWLLSVNPDMVTARDRQGATVIDYAVKSRAAEAAGILAVVKLLLDARPLALTLKYVPDEKTEQVGTTTAASNTPTLLQDTVTHHSQRSNQVGNKQFKELIETFLTLRADNSLCLHRLCAGNWQDPISLSMLDGLLEPPADINDTDVDGCTAMHYLVRHLVQIEAARHLISRGADVTVANLKGNTSLHELMKGTMIRRLDEHGNPDPTQPRDAPTRAREEWIKFLVEAGGSMHKPNAAGQTPIQLLGELNERIRCNLQKEAARLSGRGRGRGWSHGREAG